MLLMTNEEYNQLSYRIIACAMAVHRYLGPGLLESAYHACLFHELRAGGIRFREQVHLPIVYDSNQIPKAYVIDILVEPKLINRRPIGLNY